MTAHLVFKWSVVFYIVLLTYACFSLNVPPADLPAFVGLVVLATCALIASKGETRRWRTICAIFLAVAVLGTALEILSGHAIKTRLEHDRKHPCHNRQLWIQNVIYGRGGIINQDWGVSYAIEHNFYWDCSVPNANGVMWDNPGVHAYFLWTLKFRSPILFFAQSQAVCTTGADAGKVYATVWWGYKWTYDTKPTGMGPLIY